MENKYLSHYLDWQNAGLFFLVSLIGLVVILLILFAFARSREKKDELTATAHGRSKGISGSTCRIIESFYELVFSSTSILFFLAAYYLIDRFLTDPTYRVPWDKYSDVILMAFIFMSIFLNLFFDKVLVRLRWITSDDKASIRLVSTIYMVLIFLYIRFIYDDLNYNELIVYFLGLVIGRFVYFDFTWPDFCKTMKGVGRNLPMLFLMLIYSGLMCFVGFKSKFLLTSNGVIVSILIAHVFMDLSIMIAHIFLHSLAEKPQKAIKPAPVKRHTNPSDPYDDNDRDNSPVITSRSRRDSEDSGRRARKHNVLDEENDRRHNNIDERNDRRYNNIDAERNDRRHDNIDERNDHHTNDSYDTRYDDRYSEYDDDDDDNDSNW